MRSALQQQTLTFLFLSAFLPKTNVFSRILQNTEQLELAARICRSKTLTSYQVNKPEVYFHFSMDFTTIFKS